MVTVSSDQAWQEARLRSIGGSEAAALYGLLSWLTPLQMYHLKRGNAEEDRSDDERLILGRAMEPVIVSLLKERTDYSITASPDAMEGLLEEADAPCSTTIYEEGLLCRNLVYPFMSCTPDGLCWLPDGPLLVFEAKNASQWVANQWAEEPPEHYRIQVMHNGIVLGRPSGILAAIVGGQSFRWAEIHWSEEEAAAHVERCSEFWDRVQSGAEPEPMPSDVLDHYPDPHEGHRIDFSDEWLKLDDRYQEVAALVKSLDPERKVLQKRFKQRLLQEQATHGTLPNGVVWKLAANGRIIREDNR